MAVLFLEFCCCVGCVGSVVFMSVMGCISEPREEVGYRFRGQCTTTQSKGEMSLNKTS